MVGKQLLNEISEQYNATGREPEAELYNRLYFPYYLKKLDPVPESVYSQSPRISLPLPQNASRLLGTEI